MSFFPFILLEISWEFALWGHGFPNPILTLSLANILTPPIKVPLHFHSSQTCLGFGPRFIYSFPYMCISFIHSISALHICQALFSAAFYQDRPSPPLGILFFPWLPLFKPNSPFSFHLLALVFWRVFFFFCLFLIVFWFFFWGGSGGQEVVYKVVFPTHPFPGLCHSENLLNQSSPEFPWSSSTGRSEQSHSHDSAIK